MNIAVDIDGTLFKTVPAKKIFAARPLRNAVNCVNELFAAGHTITLYTARGMTRLAGQAHLIPEAYWEKTVRQLTRAGVRYHHLVFGKLAYDLLIDDKATTMAAILAFPQAVMLPIGAGDSTHEIDHSFKLSIIASKHLPFDNRPRLWNYAIYRHPTTRQRNVGRKLTCLIPPCPQFTATRATAERKAVEEAQKTKRRGGECLEIVLRCFS
jgi:hypothetical protein